MIGAWSVEEERRFFSKVRLVPSGCWEWVASCGPNGYGQFSTALSGRRTMARAHRHAFLNLRADDIDDLDLDHLCRNRRCVNPAHLEPVPRSVNTKRGLGPKILSERQTSKTHCPQGHPYDEANTARPRRGGRACRICARAAQRRWRARHGL